MKEKKNIDNIFNEGFKNFEATPSPRVWENIQASLNEKKNDRKVIPLWIKLGGVAALIALVLTVGDSLYNTSNTPPPQVTDHNVEPLENNLQENNAEVDKNISPSQIASEEKTLQSETTQEQNISEKNNSKNNTEAKPSNKVFKNTSENGVKTAVATNKSDKGELQTKQKSGNKFVENPISKNGSKEGMATSKNISEKANSNLIKDKEAESTSILDSKKEGIAANQNLKEENLENSLVKTEAEIAKENKNKKSIFEAIAEKDDEIISEKKANQKPERRWNISPNVAPVYYSSLGNGSSIDPTFGDNPQEGDVNMSYGVQVSYALSNRLSVRAGINNVDLSYSTAGIDVGTGPVALALNSVDYGGRQIVLTAVDKGSLANAAPSNGFGDIMPKSTKGEARLIQNINYYEMPVELKYAVLDSKFGINVIGGLSTLFLGNNEISVKADNFNSVLGEANNLSSVSFSTNVGLGLDYKLSKKFTFNIEPMFKYQLNPYTDSAVDFKPYYLGVYSGFSFKF